MYPHRQMAKKICIAALLAAAGTAPSIASTLQLPAINDPPSPEHHAGKVILVELVTPDLAAAEQFYGGLLGWTFQDVQLGGGIRYAEASLNGRPIAGLIQRAMPPGERRQPAWLTFISATNVDAATATAVQHGGKVLFAPHDVPNRGREAVLADPQGAVFAVLASTSGDPPDFMAAPGEWIWSSLITRDPDTDAAFYQSLFDYDVFDVSVDAPGPETAPGSSPGNGEHYLLSTGDYARATANGLPVTKSNMPSHWLNYVRVDDAAQMAAKAAALGGHVLVQPRPDRQGGTVTIVADPQGAVIGLLEWPDTASKEVAK